ncbi:glycosyltransferase, partial [bacterium]|nr:glycosyltransferase [bacterium]
MKDRWTSLGNNRHSESMRILILTPTFLPALGGAELVILQVYRRLATRHSVLVLTPYLSEDLLKMSSSKEYDRLINFGVERYHDRVTLMKIPGHRVTCALIPPFSLSAASAIKYITNEFKPDVINVHYVMPTGFSGLYAQKVLKIPTVVTYNGRDVPGPGVPLLWKYWHRLIGRNCADMTFVSKYCRDVIYGPESEHGHVIYNGVAQYIRVESDQVNALRNSLQLGKDQHVLFALQRLDYLKRTDIIIHGMKEILKSRPDTRLVIGGKGADFPRLKDLATELGISKEVI